MPELHVIDHPVIQTKLTELRDFAVGHRQFRATLDEVAMLMTYELTRDFPTRPRPVRTPLERVTGAELARPVTLVPILRAGLGMSAGVLRVLPEARVGHLGVQRNEDTLRPVDYYRKLPPDVAETEVILIDPMLATGGSAVAAAEHLKSAGVPGGSIRLLCLVAAPEGVRALHAAHPDVAIYTAAIDRELDENGYIRPGLGDAGDRVFGT